MDIKKLASDFQGIKDQVTKGVIPFDSDLLTAITYFKVLSKRASIIDAYWHRSTLKLLISHAYQTLYTLEGFAHARELDQEIQTINNKVDAYLKTVPYLKWFKDMAKLCKEDKGLEVYVALFKKNGSSD